MYNTTIQQIKEHKQTIKKLEDNFIKNLIKSIKKIENSKLKSVSNCKLLKVISFSDLDNWDINFDKIKNYLIQFCERESFSTISLLVKTLEQSIENNTELYIYEHCIEHHKFLIKEIIKEKEYDYYISKNIPKNFCVLLYENLKSI